MARCPDPVSGAIIQELVYCSRVPENLLTMKAVILLSDVFAYDSHLHTIYSGHSHPDMTVDAIIGQMQEVGLKQIAITEHVFVRSDLGRVGIVASQISRDAENVLLGAEMDADAIALDGTLVAPTDGIDWVVASFHKFPGTSIWWNQDYREAKDEKTIYREWLDWAHEVVAVSKPDAIGHPGTLICHLSTVEEFDKPILRDFAGILESCREHGVAFELNELTHKKMRPLQKETYYRVFKLAKEKGVKIVLGSDSHSLPQIGRYLWIREVIDQAGLERSDFIIPTKR